MYYVYEFCNNLLQFMILTFIYCVNSVQCMKVFSYQRPGDKFVIYECTITSRRGPGSVVTIATT